MAVSGGGGGVIKNTTQNGKRAVYPAYKDSGVEWLGAIPVHWETWKVTHGFRYIGSGTTPKSDNDAYYGGDVPWVTTSELRENQIDKTIKKLTKTAIRDYPALRLYPVGTLLFAMYGATIGRLGILGIPATVNQACAAFSQPTTLDPKFTYYWLQMRRPTLIALAVGGGQPNLSQDDLKAVRIPAPPLAEQRAIVAFLDHRTARIDALIAKKQRQIELLQEKRAALITHSVTKGLDSDAEMKGSGIEWLGTIPAHWEVKRIKQLGSIRYGLGEPPEYVDDGLPFIRATDINFGKINLDVVKRIRPDDVPWNRRPDLKLHEILVVRSGAYTGDSALVVENAVGCIAGYDMVLSVSKAHPAFVAWVMLSKYMLHSQIYLEKLRAAQPHLNAEELGGFVIVVPMLNEQRAIAAFLDHETTRIDALVSKVRESIEILREYRAALISAAVTGRIDVCKGIAA